MMMKWNQVELGQRNRLRAVVFEKVWAGGVSYGWMGLSEVWWSEGQRNWQRAMKSRKVWTGVKL
jgi:hypothetical protein